jgi:hypothetical protein
MKKLILAFSMLVFAASGTTYALELNSFNVDEEFAIAEFAELDELEATVQTANLETMTYQEIVAKSEFNEALFLRDGISGDDGGGFSLDDMDWASFAWGFCCCPVGFFVVAINKNKDKDQKVSFWIGYGSRWVLNLIGFVVQIAANGAVV